jgi:hypothetical protein
MMFSRLCMVSRCVGVMFCCLFVVFCCFFGHRAVLFCRSLINGEKRRLSGD